MLNTFYRTFSGTPKMALKKEQRLLSIIPSQSLSILSESAKNVKKESVNGKLHSIYGNSFSFFSVFVFFLFTLRITDKEPGK